MNQISQRSLPRRIQREISLASLKRCAVFLLSLTGIKTLKDKHMHTYADPHHTRIHAHTPAPQGRPLSSSPGGNDDSHYRLRARLATVPLSAVLLSCPTALLYWCCIISFPLSFEVHQEVVARWGMGLGEWQELTWKVTAGWNYCLTWLAKI